MKNYAETKKELDRIRDEYGCKGEVIFRSALQYIVEYGQIKFNNDEWVKEQLMLVDGKHDEAEVEGKHLFIGRDFEKALVECSREIAKVNSYDLLVYIQKEVWLSNDGGMDYQRAIELLKECMCQIEADENYNNVETRDVFYSLGFSDDELETFRFGYLLNNEEDEDEDC